MFSFFRFLKILFYELSEHRRSYVRGICVEIQPKGTPFLESRTPVSCIAFQYVTGTAHRAFNHIERLNRRLARFTRGFACFFLWSRFCLIVFPADFDTGVAVVGQHIDNNTGYHFLQLVNKLRGLEIATLYTAQLVFPYACKLGTFKQILVNNANEIGRASCRERVCDLV